MNVSSQAEKTGSRGTCSESGMILCEHPKCSETFPYKSGKKYHSQECKRDIEQMIIREGKKALNRGKIHSARLEKSDRLQRVARFLSDGKPHTTRDIILECDVCAVNAIVGELRDNGFEIDCKCIGRGKFEYKMVGGFTELLRVVN